MKLNYLFIQLFTISISILGFAQDTPEPHDEKLRGYYSFLEGVASFPGYCIGFELGAIKKLNNFSLAGNYHSEYGNRAPGFITKYSRYNNIFLRWCFITVNCLRRKISFFMFEGGPGLFFYNDKSLGSSGGYLTTNSTANDRTTTVGLSAQTGIHYYFYKKNACGLRINTNLNSNYLIYAGQTRFMVFMN